MRKNKSAPPAPDPYTRLMRVTKDGFLQLLLDLEEAKALGAHAGYGGAPVKVFSGGAGGALFPIRITEGHYAALTRKDFTERYTSSRPEDADG